MRRARREGFPRHRLQRKPIVSNPGMHHGTCVTHVPRCMSGWRGKRSRHSRGMHNSQFYVSGKRPKAKTGVSHGMGQVTFLKRVWSVKFHWPIKLTGVWNHVCLIKTFMFFEGVGNSTHNILPIHQNVCILSGPSDIYMHQWTNFGSGNC